MGEHISHPFERIGFMNFASWVILGIVVVVIGLAIRATFFKKKGKGGCCDTGDPMTASCPASGCSGCTCESCHVAKNALQPTIKPAK